MSLDLLGWRRQVAALYAEVRAEPDPRAGHRRWREVRDRLMADHPSSPAPGSPPLPVADYDPAWRAEVALEPAPPQRLEIPTATDGVVPFERIGVLRTPWGPLDAWWLDSYGGGLWVPVKDPSPRTYGGGRYLYDTVKGADLGSGPDGRLVVDLNFLYAPSCAHDPAWACPLAPEGDVLDVEVPVGELSGS